MAQTKRLPWNRRQSSPVEATIPSQRSRINDGAAIFAWQAERPAPPNLDCGTWPVRANSTIVQENMDLAPAQPEAVPPRYLHHGDDDISISQMRTLQEWEQLALARNPALQVAAANVRAAQGRALQAGLYPNPTAGYIADEIGNEGQQGMQGGYVQQTFITGGKLSLSREVALREVEEARRNRDAALQRILTDVRMGYYRVLVAQRRRQLNQQLFDVARESAASVEKLVEVLQAAPADLLQAQIEAEQSRLGLQNAIDAHQGAWRQLVTVAGVPGAEVHELDGNLDELPPDISWDDALAQVLAENPLLLAARARIQRGAAATQRALVEPIPNIMAMASVQRDTATESTVANVQVGVTLPIFNRNQGTVAEASAQTLAAQRDLQRLELDLRQRLAIAFRDYRIAREQAQTYDMEILPKSRRSLNLVREGYQNKQLSYTALLTAQRTYFQAELMRLDAVGRLWEAAYLMRGMLLEGSLGGTPLTPASPGGGMSD